MNYANEGTACCAAPQEPHLCEQAKINTQLIGEIYSMAGAIQRILFEGDRPAAPTGVNPEPQCINDELAIQGNALAEIGSKLKLVLDRLG